MQNPLHKSGENVHKRLDGPYLKEAVLGGRTKLLSSSMKLNFAPPHKYNSKDHQTPSSSRPFIASATSGLCVSALPYRSELLFYKPRRSFEFISSSRSSVQAVMTKEEGKELEQQGFAPKDYTDPPPAALIDANEFKLWSLYRALIAEFIATLLFLYITIATVIGHSRTSADCGSVGVLGIAWSFGGMIFVLVYCTAGISGGHINPAVTFGLFLARKVSLPRAILYMIAQCLGAICGAGLVKAFQKSFYDRYGGGANFVHPGYTKGVGLAAEIIGTFVLVYTVFSATDPKRSARDSHVPVLAPLPIGFAVFMVHLATIPITGTGINPARSFGAAVIYGHKQSWDDHWIFWVGPFVGAALAAAYHQYILRAAAVKALGSYRSNVDV